MSNPIIPISWGELIDKITILQIKLDQVTSSLARTNVKRELAELETVFGKCCPKSIDSELMERELKAVNQQLWNIEDEIREKERKRSFDDEFIQLARSVYIKNDERARIKRKINEIFGSDLIEEKLYKPY